jgi:hypothetical protein
MVGKSRPSRTSSNQRNASRNRATKTTVPEKPHLTTLNEIDEEGGKMDTIQYLEREVSRME